MASKEQPKIIGVSLTMQGKKLLSSDTHNLVVSLNLPSCSCTALCLPPRPQRHVSLPRKVRRSTRNCPKVVYDAMSGDDEEEEEEEDLQQSSPKQHQKKRRTDNDALPDDEVCSIDIYVFTGLTWLVLDRRIHPVSSGS